MNTEKPSSKAMLKPPRQRRLGRSTLFIAAVVTGFHHGLPDATAQPAPDYSSFRIIAERNIFNANRSGRATTRPREESAEPPRVDAFTLVGTMSYGKGPFAFFNGTSSEYRKVLQPGETIADYKLTHIARDQVKLEAATNQFELRVGMQLRREQEGPWQLQAQDEPDANSSSHGDSRREDSGRGDSRGFDSRRGDSRNSDSRPASSTSPDRGSTPPRAAAPSLSSEQENEILKRLMQQREKELK